jgi:hypothetical protein
MRLAASSSRPHQYKEIIMPKGKGYKKVQPRGKKKPTKKGKRAK